MKNLSFCIKESNSNSINANGMDIENIDILPTSKTNILILSLSFNHISNLSNLKQFNLLTTLFLDSNCIDRISQLEPLSKLTHLKNISFSGNKVCFLPLFKAHVINFCPKLEILDGKEVSSFFTGKYSRELYKIFINQEKTCFKFIYINDIIVQCLNYQKKKQKRIEDRFSIFVQSQNYKEKIHDLRLRCKSLSPTSYFKFLRQTMVGLTQIIFQTATSLNLDEKLLSQYSSIVKTFDQINQFSSFLEEFKKLILIGLSLINHKLSDFDDNIFNEFSSSTQILSNHQAVRNKNMVLNSSDSISSQFCISDGFNNHDQKLKKIISNDDNDSASLSNDSYTHTKKTTKIIHEKNQSKQTNSKSQSKQNNSKSQSKQNNSKNNQTNNQNLFSSDFEFSSEPLKTSSSSENISFKSTKTTNKRIHEEEPASEETLPKSQQSVSSEMSNYQNGNCDKTNSNLFLTELASEEIISKSQQSMNEDNSIKLIKFKDVKNTSTEIDADEVFGFSNTTSYIQSHVNQSISPELADDEITQNTQSEVLLNHFQTSQVELASDEGNLDSEPHQTNQSLSIEVASSSSSNNDEFFDQLSEGNENSKTKLAQVELANNEAAQLNSFANLYHQTSSSFNAIESEDKRKRILNEIDHLHSHPLKIPHSASLEFASDENLSNNPSESDDENAMKNSNKSNYRRNSKPKIANAGLNSNSVKLEENKIQEEEELASEEGQNDEHAVLFDSKVIKNLKALQESFSLDEMASGETLPSTNPMYDEDSDIKERAIKLDIGSDDSDKNHAIDIKNQKSGCAIKKDADNKSDNNENPNNNRYHDDNHKILKKAENTNHNSKNDNTNHNKNDNVNNRKNGNVKHSKNDNTNYNKNGSVNHNKNDNAKYNKNGNASHSKNGNVHNSKNDNVNDNDPNLDHNKHPLKQRQILPSSSALSTYFKIWKMNYNFRVKRREMIKERLMEKYNLSGKVTHLKEMQKKQQLMNSIERQKEINESKYRLFKQLNCEYQKTIQSSE